MADVLTLDSAHNFGIYTKSGKRTIFQIDFSCKKISLIERGKINKAYTFENLETYDSEENLHIILRFRGNKTLDFDADTAEEKYTICRLLGLILGADQIESNGTGTDARPANGLKGRLSTKKQIIKEGVLEKKGNTKIPTWSKRRLQVCPGEFSYFKPGDEVALNLVQLWENCTTISRNGNAGFTVAVKDRAYHYRVLNEKGVVQEEERNRWIQAFQQASQRKRATFLLLEMSKPSYVNTHEGVPLPEIPLDFEDDVTSYYNQQNVSNGSSGSASSREFLEGLEAINELDEVLNDETQDGAPSYSRNIALSVVKKEGPMLASPTKGRARPPAIGNIKGSFTSEDKGEQPNYDYIPDPDYSPPPSPTPGQDSTGSPRNNVPGFTREEQASGVYKKVIDTGVRSSGAYKRVIDNEPMDRKASGVYNKVIKSSGDSRESGIYRNVINNSSGDSGNTQSLGESGKSFPGAVDVMPKVEEIPKLRRVNSKPDEVQANDSPRRNSGDNVYYNAGVSVKQIQANMEHIYVNENTDKMPIKSTKNKPPPPAPSGPRPASGGTKVAPPAPCPMTDGPQPPAPPPPPGFPAPPPPLLDRQATRGKLKQVHWNKTPKQLIANSIWEQSQDLTSRLNLKLLEEQFSLKEKAPVSTNPAPKPGGKQLLIDGKRAQNLGIFMSGLKNNTGKLVEVLNSVTEDEDFPAEKLTTIRRYQPTEDEIDMYRAYSHKRHELHEVDQFMLQLCEIPCLSIRIDICLTLWDFPWQYESTCQLIDQVHSACDELLDSQMLVIVLEYILAIGNHLNRNWSDRNVSKGFQITSLDKILDIRGKDTGYTMVHFLAEQLRLSDPGLVKWTETVTTVTKCDQVSVKSVAAEIEVLKGDLTKIKRHLKTLRAKTASSSRQDSKFQQDAQNLTVEYEMKLEKLDRRCAELQSKYKRVLTRFGEPPYQQSDQVFAVIASFANKFKSALKDSDTKPAERKVSLS